MIRILRALSVLIALFAATPALAHGAAVVPHSSWSSPLGETVMAGRLAAVGESGLCLGGPRRVQRGPKTPSTQTQPPSRYTPCSQLVMEQLADMPLAAAT